MEKAIMEPMLLFVILILVFCVVMFTPFNGMLLRLLYKSERMQPVSSTAQNNVRLHNAYNGVTYIPKQVEPIDNDDYEFDVHVESTEPPYRTTILRVTRQQLKVDPIEVIITGLPNIRIVPRDFMDANFGINDNKTMDPKYTDRELDGMSSHAFYEKTALEGKIATLQANRREDLKDAVDHVTTIIGAQKTSDSRRQK